MNKNHIIYLVKPWYQCTNNRPYKYYQPITPLALCYDVTSFLTHGFLPFSTAKEHSYNISFFSKFFFDKTGNQMEFTYRRLTPQYSRNVYTWNVYTRNVYSRIHSRYVLHLSTLEMCILKYTRKVYTRNVYSQIHSKCVFSNTLERFTLEMCILKYTWNVYTQSIHSNILKNLKWLLYMYCFVLSLTRECKSDSSLSTGMH